jgi:hypothetical protein
MPSTEHSASPDGDSVHAALEAPPQQPPARRAVRALLQVLAVILGLLLQAWLVRLALHGGSRGAVLLLCLAGDALAAAVLAWAALAAVPPRLRTPQRPTWLFLWLLAFCIPVGGVLAAVIGLRIAEAFPKPADNLPIELVREPEFSIDMIVNVSYGRSARLKAELKNTEADTSYRMTALLAMQSMPTRTISPVLRGMLSDPLDDLRLLAYGMLDNHEKILTHKILQERPKLSLALSPAERYTVNQSLAGLYSELIYANLVQGDVYMNAAEQADAYAAAALEIEPGDGALWRLRGRLALLLRKLDQADVMLERSIECGFSRGRMLPYLAEAAYARADYARVRELMGAMQGDAPPMLLPMLNYWTL